MKTNTRSNSKKRRRIMGSSTNVKLASQGNLASSERESEKPGVPSWRSLFWIGFAAGLAAGAVATGLMLLLSLTQGGVSLPEAFGSELTALMPPAMFEYLHRLIGGDAKHYLFYGILVGQCLVFALSGGLCNLIVGKRIVARMAGMLRQESEEYSYTNPPLLWYHGLLLVVILWLFTGLVFLPLTGAGIFGAQLSIGPVNTMVSLAEVGLIFGILFILTQNWIAIGLHKNNGKQASNSRNEEEPTRGALDRRTLLKRGAILVGIGVVGVGLWQFITNGISSSSVPVARLLQHFKSKIVPPPVPNYDEIHPAPFLSPEITPNDQFYIVSKNLVSDPTVNGTTWHLTVDGYVDHPFTLTYQQVLALPMKQQYESLMCVSNEVGGQYMSNALWEGIPLMDLLQQAGLKPGATKVVFHATDDYSDSIHLSKALEPTTMMAVRMNGVRLPDEHGFPARMLVPGIYGMKHCKWLTRIEVVNSDYQGYWQQRGWSDLAAVRLTSRIDTPLIGSQLPANKITYIAGVAFSGNKGISEVDVSTDAGQTWQRAILKKPLSDLTWVLWELAWQPPRPGNYAIVVRAIDLEGNVQNPEIDPPLPNGSSGYHSIDVSVS